MNRPNLFSDTKAAADQFNWITNLERRKRRAGKRGRPKISIEELENELALKVEAISTMTTSLDKLTEKTSDEIISESDLEEICDLLSTDDESETESKGNFVKK